jgi:hypothetical protein
MQENLDQKESTKLKKRHALKVSCSGNTKKQKTPNKSNVQGAVKQLGQEELNLMLDMAKADQDSTGEMKIEEAAAAIQTDPNLLGTHDEARQEK